MDIRRTLEQTALFSDLDDEGFARLVDRVEVGAGTSIQREQVQQLGPGGQTFVPGATQVAWIFSPTNYTSHTVPFLQVKQEVKQLQEQQPPAGKLTPWDYLKQYSKPWLPQDVTDLFKRRCRALEAPQWFQPQGAAHPWPYYTLPTLETAYAQATRQLSFLEAPWGWSRRRG